MRFFFFWLESDSNSKYINIKIKVHVMYFSWFFTQVNECVFKLKGLAINCLQNNSYWDWIIMSKFYLDLFLLHESRLFSNTRYIWVHILYFGYIVKTDDAQSYDFSFTKYRCSCFQNGISHVGILTSYSHENVKKLNYNDSTIN